MLRSILAIAGGYLGIAILTMVTFAAMTALFPGAFEGGFPALPWVLFILGFGFVYAIIGGYITALLAAQAQFKHVLALAGLMLILGIFSALFSPIPQPLWYQIALVVLGLAGVLVGGRLRVARQL